jgi:hypothetical protein
LVAVLILASLCLPATVLAAAVSPVLTGSVSSSTVLSGVSATAFPGPLLNQNYVYTADYFRGTLGVVDVSNPAQPTIVGESASANTMISSTTVNIFGGYAYVVSKNRNGPSGSKSNDDGTGNGLTILDIATNPTQPIIVGSIRDPINLFGAYGIGVSGSYAYVAAQGCLSGQPCPNQNVGDSFVVVNISDPFHPAIVATIKNSSLPSPWTGSGALKHATAVAIDGHYAYVTASYSNRLTVIDIANPLNPTIVSSIQDNAKLGFDVDVAVANGYAYVADQGTATGRVAVVDVHDPANPQIVGVVPSTGGMLNGGYRIRLRGNFAYVSAVNSHAVGVVDISNPNAPRFVGGLINTTSLYKTTGLDVGPTGRYVFGNSPYQSTQTQNVYPPFPFAPGAPTYTGTIWGVDLTPAAITATITASSKPPAQTTQTSATFTFSSNLAVSTFRCRLDGAPYGLCTGATSQALTGLSPGSHTFDVQAIDSAGNTATDSYTWTVVATLPAAPPLTPVLDDFNRANGPAGSNWSLIRPSGFAGMNISGNTAVDSSTSAFTWDYWNGATFGPDAEAYATIARLGASDTIRIGARISAAGTNNHSGYYVQVTTAGVWSIIRVDKGTATTLATVSRPLATGDTIGIRIVGSVLSALHQTPTGDWVQVMSYDTSSDTTRYTNAGNLAVEFKTSALDNFAGGTYVQASAPANTSPPSVSGSAVEGQLLTASPGSWTGTPAPTFAYQWTRCDSSGLACVPIAGATDSVYTLTSADVGSTVAVTVTASNFVGSAGPVSSAATGVVQSATTPPANTTLPSISGSAVENQVLTASPGVWTGQPAPTFAYQWLRCDTSGASCAPIVGETAATHTLVTADVGSTIAVGVTATNSSGSAGPVSSAATAVVQSAPVAPANSMPPSISGSVVDGQVLTASPGVWTGQPAPSISYQWLRCDSSGSSCAPIGGATASTYALVTADVGSTIVVAVTATNTAGSSGPVNSPATAVIQALIIPPANSSTPSISGTPVDNQVLTASPGVWTGQPAPSFSYQWLQCDTSGASCAPIGAATGSTYTIVTADVGSTIVVAVTATNSGGSEGPVNSGATSVVQAAPVPPANTTQPSISGSTVQGQQLSASAGVWTGQPAPTFSYQWLRCDSSGSSCSPIGGATGSAYTLVAADIGSTIVVAVTATNSGGSAGPVNSSATGVVQPFTAAPVNTTPPSISGTLVDGSTLTASPGVWSGQPAPTLAYQWLRCDSSGASCVPIGGATGSTYTLVTADVGSTVAVAVTATNTVGSAGPVNSAATAVIASSLAPTTPVLDNFNRADGAAGANWALIRPTGFATMNVSANQAVDSSTTNFAWDFWNGANFGPNVEAYVTVANLGVADVIRIGGRVINAGSNSHSGYYVAVTPTGAWTILRMTSGSPTTLASGTRTIAAGDKVAIRIVGTVVRALHWSPGTGWVQVLSYDTAADATKYTAAGRLALEFRAAALDDFGGGTLP